MTCDLDAYDRKILALLQENARISYSELSRRVHLTAPAVTERVKRLEEAGVIEGYTTRINLRRLGYSFEALIHVTVDSHPALDAWALAHPEVLAIHATTGESCALVRVAITEPEHLQALIQELSKLGKTSTSLVLSSQLENRVRIPGDSLA